MGLGSAVDVPLKRARELAAAARALVAEGRDPIAAREAAKAEQAVEATIPTFGAFAEKLIDEIEGGFRNSKHRDQWRMTLLGPQPGKIKRKPGPDYCKAIRSKLVDEITTEDVLAVLQPIWMKKAETAKRLRGRIERVLDAAKAAGHRTGENPARLKGHLGLLLPKQPKLQRGHHAAMPYEDLPEFWGRLTTRQSVSCKALAFTVLTAARTTEVLEAKWGEVDIAGRVWAVPAARMKMDRDHRVPLVDSAVAILEELIQFAPKDEVARKAAFIFPGARAGRPLSAMSMTMRLRDLGGGEYTVHGFRSSFRDYIAEETPHARGIAEAALAHIVGDATERAYRRGDALEKRRGLMVDWEAHLISKRGENVVPIRPATA